MNGHQQLLALRRRGAVPMAVWITDSDDDYSRMTAADWDVRPATHTGRLFAHVRVETHDIPEGLDLRCVQGLICHIATDRGPKRFARLFAALVDAGASVVVGVHDDHVEHFKKEENGN